MGAVSSVTLDAVTSRLGVNECFRKRLRDLTPGPHPWMRSWGWTKGLHTDSAAGLGSGVEAQIISSGAGRGWREGSTPQISRAYWAMVRSLENLPEVAMFRITIRVHSLGFYRPKGNSGFTLQVGSPATPPPIPARATRALPQPLAQDPSLP